MWTVHVRDGDLSSSGPPTTADADTTDQRIDEETVIQVAADRSLDSQRLDTTPTDAEGGIHGQLPRR